MDCKKFCVPKRTRRNEAVSDAMEMTTSCEIAVLPRKAGWDPTSRLRNVQELHQPWRSGAATDADKLIMWCGIAQCREEEHLRQEEKQKEIDAGSVWKFGSRRWLKGRS